MSGAALPAPLVDPECDLRAYDWIPLFHRRLRGSDFWRRASDTAKAISVELWCRSYEEVPAASIPDDDHTLSDWAGFGRRDLSAWLAVRVEVLSAWVKCSDGRFYHPTLSEVAATAWAERRVRVAKREEERQRKASYRARKSTGTDAGHLAASHGTAGNVPQDTPACPTEEASLWQPQPKTEHVPRDSELSPAGISSESVESREIKTSVPSERAARADSEATICDQNAEAWSRGVRLLAGRGRMRDGQARSLFGKLLRDSHLQAGELLPAIVTGEASGTQEPQSYLRKAAEGVARRKGSLPDDGRPRSGRLGGWTATAQAMAFGGEVEISPAEPDMHLLGAAA